MALTFVVQQSLPKNFTISPTYPRTLALRTQKEK
jgi:hypothetical protein